MKIEKQLQIISKKIHEKKIQSAFELIKKLINEYPQNVKLREMFEINALKYQKQMPITKDKISELYKIKGNDIPISIINNLFKIDPKNAYIFSYLGDMYGIKGDFKKAREFQEKAVIFNPFELLFYVNLAKTYQYLGLFSLSNRFLEYYLLIYPKNEKVLLLYARNMFTLSNFEKSFQLYKKLILLGNVNTSIEYKKEYFHKLINANKLNEAHELLNSLANLNNEKNNNFDQEVFYLSGILNIAEKDYLNAKHNFQSCLNLDNNHSASYTSLAVINERENDFNGAIDNLNKAIQIDEFNFRAISNLGIIYSHLGDVNKAIPLMKRSLRINPFNYEAKYILGQMQIYNKEYKEGWRNFQSRWFYHNYSHRRLMTSNKVATKLEKGKTYLLWSEQGIGDQIMYGSMFLELSKYSKKIIIKIDQRLTKIFKTETKNIYFVGKDEIVSDNDFDYHLPFGDIGMFLRGDIDSFKKAKFPYIKYNFNIYEMIKNKLSDRRFIIGISWTSYNNLLKDDKSVYLRNLKSILNLNNIYFIDLEYKNSEIEKYDIYKELGVKINKIENIDMFNDIIGVSSIINACDLVITCSNVNAHLAGALNKKTFLLLPIGKGRLWNWSSINNQSLWYPSVKIFQQESPGDWTAPVEKIRKEILVCQNC